MRRLLGLRGGVARQDVLPAADAYATSNNGDDFTAWVAYGRAKQKGAKGRATKGVQRKVKNKAKGGGQSRNCLNAKTGPGIDVLVEIVNVTFSGVPRRK